MQEEAPRPRVPRHVPWNKGETNRSATAASAEARLVSARVEDGYVASFARPGGNITGFSEYEPSIGGRRLETLKQVAPATKHVAVIVNPKTAPMHGTFYQRAFETDAASMSVEPTTRCVESPGDIESAMAELGRQSGTGLIVAPETLTMANRELFVTLAARLRIPAMPAAVPGERRVDVV